MKIHFLVAVVAMSLGWRMGPHEADAASRELAPPADLDFFETKIRPILVNHCYTCHSADTKPAGGLRVDDRNGLLTGGDTGPAIIPGEPEKSLLLKRVRHEDVKRRMPKEGQLLTETQIADLTSWIENGAAWPRDAMPASLGTPPADYEQLKARHWAWQPLTDPEVPAVAQTSWPRSTIDRFILATLERKKLTPVQDADPVTLIRRVTFDLTGLPPTPAEIEAFVTNTSEHAWARLVDRLLASPSFGECWGRHWLDVARYGESTGPSRNIPYPHAWKYRDYVIDSVNRDVPYDQFIREQIAGDLLPAATAAERDRLLTATGFLALGVKDVNQRFKVRFVMDNVDEQIDAVTRSVLALTVSCARCHDHKFDPISARDYYALAGIFTSTENCAGVRNKMGGGGLDYYAPASLVRLLAGEAAPAVPQEQIEQLQGRVAEAKKQWDAIRGTPEGLALASNGAPKQRPFRLKYEKLQSELAALTDPVTRGQAVHGVREAKTIGDTEFRIRGEAERLGPTVPRGFLTTYPVPGALKINPQQSGRLELAQWLTSTNNALAVRVIVNRVWQRLFGQGIVSTVDNFGAKGDPPSHPELLDHLVNEFIRDDWSIKKLVRTILLSRAYQLGSEAPATHREIDPATRLVWRHAPRRLDAEEFRDATLVASGQLDPKPPGGSPAKELKMIEMRDNGPEARAIHESADQGRYRSIYLPLLRGVTPQSIEPFDPVDQTLVSGQRASTTVPTQALYLLNSTFVRRQSLALANRLLSHGNPSDAERVRQAYLLTLGRAPNPSEITRAETFVARYESMHRRLPPEARPAVAMAAPEKSVRPKPAAAIPVNPDDIDRTTELPVEETVVPQDPKLAAWMSFVQALYASAEFRFVR